MHEDTNVERLCREAFATITAMVTHDLKNTLAIINENAGLLEDLAQMCGDDGVPPPRVEGAAGTIAQQVARSTRIIRNLNRFAHSGDTEVASSAIGDVVELVAELTSRRAAMRKVRVEVDCDAGHQVELALMCLAALCCRLLLALYEQAEQGTVISVNSTLAEAELLLRFSMVPAPGKPVIFPGAMEESLISALRARCQGDGDGVLLCLPARGAA